MIVHRLAHLGGEIFRHALAVHRLGASLLEGHAVKLDVFFPACPCALSPVLFTIIASG